MRQKHKFLHPVFVAALLITMVWLLLAPTPLPFGITVQREMGFVGHVGIFSMVTLVCVAVFPHSRGRMAAALLIAAACLEAAQLFIPTRGAEMADLAMNCLGILVGFLLFRAGVALTT